MGVDSDFILWLGRLIQDGFSDETVHNLTSLLVLKRLKSAATLSIRGGTLLLQVGEGESRTRLQWLEREGLLTSDTESTHEWRLSARARRALEAAGASAPREIDLERWILDHLEDSRSLTNREVTNATGAVSREVTRVLRYLADTQRISKDPTGPSRGPGVRWSLRGAR